MSATMTGTKTRPTTWPVRECVFCHRLMTKPGQAKRIVLFDCVAYVHRRPCSDVPIYGAEAPS